MSKIQTPQHTTPSDGCVWVTGASSGIGKAVCLELAKRGWIVAATARRQDELEALAIEASGLLGRIVAHPADVTDEKAIRSTVATIEMAHGPIALAFLNAGIAPDIRAPDIDMVAIRQVFNVNVVGVFTCLSALMPIMAGHKRGQIAVNASVAGYGGLPKSAAYGATKAALINACESLKFDCDQIGIKLQLVNPGFIATPLTDKNDFPMPFLIADTDFAKRVVDGFATKSFELTYPRRLAYILKFLNLLPYPIYFWLVGKTTGVRES
jgi:NAD(P)-dependent dehydrogenase (short-subunit alcohol dehydrogenase family)